MRRHKVAAYQEEIKDIPLEKIAYVDESISAVVRPDESYYQDHQALALRSVLVEISGIEPLTS